MQGNPHCEYSVPSCQGGTHVVPSEAPDFLDGENAKI